MITLHNYEEYFILYMDNELTGEERRKVELFLEHHPELKGELTLLEQYRLPADQSISFPDKASLLKPVVRSGINPENYHEWLYLYVDNELDEEKRKAVEVFASEHPAVQKELSTLLKTKLSPDTARFEHKDSLYRSTPSRQPITYWLRIAAAILLLFTTGYVSLLNTRTSNERSLSDNKALLSTEPARQTVNEQPIQNNQEIESAITPAGNNDITGSAYEPEPNKKTAIQKETTTNPKPVSQDNISVAKASNNLPSPENNPRIRPANSDINDLAISTSREKAFDASELTNENVTPSHTQPLNSLVRTAAYNNTDVFTEDNGKKNAFRGLFRKITRVVEKRTNIDATDDDNKLLVAGLTIHLK